MAKAKTVSTKADLHALNSPMTNPPKPEPGWYVVFYENVEGVEREEKRLGPYSSEHLADKADNGVNRNLNHERFYTRVIERL